MILDLIFQSFIFWALLSALILTTMYVIKFAKSTFEYEKQVDRGWDDLMRKQEEMINKLNDAIKEVQDIKNHIKETRKTKSNP